jgi:DNA-binding response OmpR family regulator
MNQPMERGKEVILVDDDKLEEIILREFLKKSKFDIALRVFNSGLQFIEHMQYIKACDFPMPSMVLLDIRMWRMDGFEVLKILRSDPSFETTPKIMVFSNSHEQSDKEKSLNLGANDYYHKPRNGKEYEQFLHDLRMAIN